MGLPPHLGMYPVFVDFTHPNYNSAHALSSGVSYLKKNADAHGVPTLTKTQYNNLIKELGLPSSMKAKSGFSERLGSESMRIVKGFLKLKALGMSIEKIAEKLNPAEVAPQSTETTGDTNMSNRPKPSNPEHPLNRFSHYDAAQSQLPADPNTSIEQSADTSSTLSNIGTSFVNSIFGQSNGISGNNPQNTSQTQAGQAQTPNLMDRLLGFGMDHVIGNWQANLQNDRLADQERAIMNAQTRGLQDRYNQLYPNTSQWERLGASGAGAGGSGISGAEQHRMAIDLKELEGRNAKDVAMINAAKDGLTELQKKILNKDIKWYEAEKSADIFSKIFRSIF